MDTVDTCGHPRRGGGCPPIQKGLAHPSARISSVVGRARETPLGGGDRASMLTWSACLCGGEGDRGGGVHKPLRLQDNDGRGGLSGGHPLDPTGVHGVHGGGRWQSGGPRRLLPLAKPLLTPPQRTPAVAVARARYSRRAGGSARSRAVRASVARSKLGFVALAGPGRSGAGEAPPAKKRGGPGGRPPSGDNLDCKVRITDIRCQT